MQKAVFANHLVVLPLFKKSLQSITQPNFSPHRKIRPFTLTSNMVGLNLSLVCLQLLLGVVI